MPHNTKPSRCASHPEETRDERFGYLDMLIQAGWGAVPMHIIENEMQSNGGTLPQNPPQRYMSPDHFLRPILNATAQTTSFHDQ